MYVKKICEIFPLYVVIFIDLPFEITIVRLQKSVKLLLL